MLRLLHDHGAASIVIEEEDKRLNLAGVASKMPDGWDGDVWARPRAAGLLPEEFSPLSSASTSVVMAHQRWDAWDAFAAGCGHPPDKLAVADRLVMLIQNETPWQRPSRRTRSCSEMAPSGWRHYSSGAKVCAWRRSPFTTTHRATSSARLRVERVAARGAGPSGIRLPFREASSAWWHWMILMDQASERPRP